MAKQTYTTGQVLTAAQMTTLQANDYNQTVSAKTANYTLVAADAGTRITMSNASTTTITVNTGVFTAGDTLIITNIGAGVTTITAGTATVSTSASLALNQYDSGNLYFSTTGAAIWTGANIGDITAVTAGTGLTGGGSSGAVTLNLATTAKGDLVAGTGASTATALTVGNNGETLVADSSTSTGLRYTAGNPIPNPFLNSAMAIWQRGTSFTSYGYTADRWYFSRDNATAGATASRQTSSLTGTQYCYRLQRNSGNTSTDAINLSQSFETVNSIPFAGKTVTLSFYARVGSNYSGTSNNILVRLFSGTGTDQNVAVSYTGTAGVVYTTQAVTTSWVRYSFTGTVDASATELAVLLQTQHSGTASTNDYLDITNVQLDIGSVALPIRSNGATIQGELAACQRYYLQYNTYYTGGIIRQSSTTQSYANFGLPVTMRAATPSLTIANQTGATIFSGGGSVITSTVAANTTFPNQFGLAITHPIVGLTGYAADLSITTLTIGVSAEL